MTSEETVEIGKPIKGKIYFVTISFQITVMSALVCVRVSLTGLRKFDNFLRFEKANLRKHDCYFVLKNKIFFSFHCP